jgi:acyl-CoA synthetase (AMP-forming)/AMP-acid ligase II
MSTTEHTMSTTTEQTLTICDAFAATAAAHASDPALLTADGAINWSWGEYAERVRATAAGLRGIGLRRGDTVALWLSNRPEFHVANTAATQLGAAPFSVYLGGAGSRFSRSRGAIPTTRRPIDLDTYADAVLEARQAVADITGQPTAHVNASCSAGSSARGRLATSPRLRSSTGSPA